MSVTCQVCRKRSIDHIMSLGYMPPVNDYHLVEEEPKEQIWMPTDLYYCSECELVQLGYEAPPTVVFPPSYPYTSGTTKILRDNFSDLARECYEMRIVSDARDAVVDIGSNDGTLLKNFMQRGHRVLGIEPTDVADAANKFGIRTIKEYFGPKAVKTVMDHFGSAKLITCANCFAHMPGIHAVMNGVLAMMASDGVFVTESTYLIDTLDKLQYDTVYHEHLRYYSLRSLKYLLEQHGLEVFHVKRIPSHGGSIRVYAALKDKRPVDASVKATISKEPTRDAMKSRLGQFSRDVEAERRYLMSFIYELQQAGGSRIVGIGAPSRASTVINYCGFDRTMIDYVCEVDGSMKIGNCMPGTSIPVVNERYLYSDQPEFALIFSWHIADEIVPKLKERGFRGGFISPIRHHGGEPSILAGAA